MARSPACVVKLRLFRASHIPSRVRREFSRERYERTRERPVIPSSAQAMLGPGARWRFLAGNASAPIGTRTRWCWYPAASSPRPAIRGRLSWSERGSPEHAFRPEALSDRAEGCAAQEGFVAHGTRPGGSGAHEPRSAKVVVVPQPRARRDGTRRADHAIPCSVLCGLAFAEWPGSRIPDPCRQQPLAPSRQPHPSHRHQPPRQHDRRPLSMRRFTALRRLSICIRRQSLRKAEMLRIIRHPGSRTRSRTGRRCDPVGPADWPGIVTGRFSIPGE
jgi:hypothetical protein